MSREEDTSRRYDEQEVQKLLTLAARIQQREEQPSVSQTQETPRGFSLAELQQIADEIGLRAEHITAAAAELEVTGGAEPHSLLGAPPTWPLERIVEGEVTEKEWQAMVAEIRRCFGQLGTPATVGDMREWQGTDGSPHVTAMSRDGQTCIRVRLRSADYLWLFYSSGLGAGALLVFAVAGSLGLDLPWQATLGALAGGLAGGLAGARSLFRTWFRHKKRVVKELLDRLAELAAAAETAPAVSPHVGYDRASVPGEASTLRSAVE